MENFWIENICKNVILCRHLYRSIDTLWIRPTVENMWKINTVFCCILLIESVVKRDKMELGNITQISNISRN